MTPVPHPSKVLTTATPAGRALRQADKGIGNWLLELVTGAGTSPAHIIITGVLGVVPGIGQAMDARDLILGIIAIAKSPAAIGGWVELVITLIGCIPAAGDALKVGFKLMKQGHNFGRVLEGVSPALRGNVEKYMRKIDWTMLAKESKGLFAKAISAFIDGLDSWVVKVVAGGANVKQIVAELKVVQKRAPAMIDEAFAELKKMHAKMMGHELPGTTAAAAATSSKGLTTAAAASAKKKARAQRKLIPKRNSDVKARRVTPNSTKNSVKKKGERKKTRRDNGVPAEHITDYQVKRKHRTFNKENNGGKLTEEKSPPHHGLDHLWSNKANATKPFVVGETKSSLFDSFRLLAALPAEMQKQFAALRADEAANPAPNQKPNIFESQGRDVHADRHVEVGGEDSDEKAIRRGVNKPGIRKDGTPTGLATQMSHEWIFSSLQSEHLTSEGQTLLRLLRRQRANSAISTEVVIPYQRWIALVTGRQLHKHAKSKGEVHEIQTVLNIPDNILKE